MALLRIPFGDATLVAGLEILGLRRGPAHAIRHYGIPRDTNAEERTARSPVGPTGKALTVMDIQADKEVPLSVSGYTDEAGNPVGTPAGVVETFTSSDPTIVAIVTADDGVLVARATGTLGGPVNIHLDSNYTDTDGVVHDITGDDSLTVVAGNAERATIAFGAPREATPDV